MQLTSREACTAPAALRTSKSFSVRPRKASDPACRKSRRRSPSQKCTLFSASNRNMTPPARARPEGRDTKSAVDPRAYAPAAVLSNAGARERGAGERGGGGTRGRGARGRERGGGGPRGRGSAGRGGAGGGQ